MMVLWNRRRWMGTFANGKDTMSLTALWVDANGNGWHDAAEAAYAFW